MLIFGLILDYNSSSFVRRFYDNIRVINQFSQELFSHSMKDYERIDY